ncbi:IS66 family insertion sequence element accessory protein TnpB [Escherichia coli]
MTDFGGKTSIFSHSVYLFLREFSLQDSRGGSHIFVFRGRSGKMVKILWADRDGLCLFAKRLERGRFIWPVTREGKVHLTPAQLSMLLEGIAWQHPKRTERPGIRI